MTADGEGDGASPAGAERRRVPAAAPWLAGAGVLAVLVAAQMLTWEPCPRLPGEWRTVATGAEAQRVSWRFTETAAGIGRFVRQSVDAAGAAVGAEEHGRYALACNCRLGGCDRPTLTLTKDLQPKGTRRLRIQLRELEDRRLSMQVIGSDATATLERVKRWTVPPP
jgi:hypothetical protein